MAGEDYTPPGGTGVFRVPTYEEPADAPEAFKQFAASIDGGSADKYDRGSGSLNYSNAVTMGATVKSHDTQLNNLPPKIHISRSDPSGGSNGDVWFKYQ